MQHRPKILLTTASLPARWRKSFRKSEVARRAKDLDCQGGGAVGDGVVKRASIVDEEDADRSVRCRSEGFETGLGCFPSSPVEHDDAHDRDMTADLHLTEAFLIATR